MPRPIRNSFPDLSKEKNAVKKLFQNLPRFAGNTALNFFDSSWEREGFIDTKVTKWQKRKKTDGRTKGRRRILVKSGRLRRSLTLRTTRTKVIISTSVPYASAHNEGETISGTAKVKAHKRRLKGGKTTKVKAHSRNINFQMPKRQFMGESKFLERRIEKNVEHQLLKIFK